MNVCKVFLRAVLCSVFSLCLLCGGLSVLAYSGSAPQQKTGGANLRVMSYNVLADPGEGGFPNWTTPAIGTRPNAAIECIKYYSPDVVGLQECSYNWYKALRPGLPDYAFVNSSDEGKEDYMCTALMYNKKTVELVSSEIIGYNDTRWGRQRMRYINTGVFKIKATGETFLFISTHFDAGAVDGDGFNRPAQAVQLGEQIKDFKAKYGCPIISVGDYNSQLRDTPLQSVMSRGGMAAATTGDIDHILYSAGITKKYAVRLSDAEVAGSSDHMPVFADLAVQKYQFPTSKEKVTTTATTTSAANYGPGVVVTKGTTKTTDAPKNTTKAPATSATDGVEETAPSEQATEQTETAEESTMSTTASVETSGTDGLPPTVWVGIGIGALGLGAIVAAILLLRKK